MPYFWPSLSVHRKYYTRAIMFPRQFSTLYFVLLKVDMTGVFSHTWQVNNATARVHTKKATAAAQAAVAAQPTSTASNLIGAVNGGIPGGSLGGNPTIVVASQDSGRTLYGSPLAPPPPISPHSFSSPTPLVSTMPMPLRIAHTPSPFYATHADPFFTYTGNERYPLSVSNVVSKGLRPTLLLGLY